MEPNCGKKRWGRICQQPHQVKMIPQFYQLHLEEQQALITPILELLKDYDIIILGDREFGSVKLAQWLCQQQVKFVLRIKQERYIQSDGEESFKVKPLNVREFRNI